MGARRILVVDSHPVVRLGLRHVFAASGEIIVAGETGLGSEALEMARSDRYDGVLLELMLADCNGLDVLRSLQRSEARMRVLLMSWQPERRYAMHAWRIGALGCISKAASVEEIIRAMRIVLDGNRFISESLVPEFARPAVSPESPLRHECLSAPEFDVFKRLAEGQAVSQIAIESLLPVKTILSHRAAIIDKTGLETLDQMTAYAIEYGLIT